MPKELYFDINAPHKGGSLFRIQDPGSVVDFYYNHSTYNEEKDELKVFESHYKSFDLFWKELTKDREWFYLHPLFVHPEQRAFIREQLRHVNWNIHPNKKWQDSHRQQWTKVLSDPGQYYSGPE